MAIRGKGLLLGEEKKTLLPNRKATPCAAEEKGDRLKPAGERIFHSLQQDQVRKSATGSGEESQFALVCRREKTWG